MKGPAKLAATLFLFVLSTTVVVSGRGTGGASAPAPSATAAAKGADFTLRSVSGEPVSLGRFAGKTPVLLFFWATWCPHCNAAVPAISKLHAEPVDGKRLTVLALDYMESPEKVGAYVKSREIPYTVLLDRDGAVARRYRVVGVPTYIVIDMAGTVVYRDHVLPPDLGKYLD